MNNTPEDDVKIAAVTDKLVGNHREYLEDIANDHGLSFDELMDAVRDWIDHGSYTATGVDIDYAAMSGEFWEHYQGYTAEVVDKEKKTNFFNCSC